MKTFLLNKDKYLKTYADIMYAKCQKLRYGIESCKPNVKEHLAFMRKKLVEWQSNEDNGALCEVHLQYKTFLPVNYTDNLLTIPKPSPTAGPGYVTGCAIAPVFAGSGTSYGNIIEVNTGGCITRINLNPAITINQNSSFQFTQQTPSTTWVIQHNMNMIPNVTTEDLDGNDIEGVINIIDNNSLRVHFTSAVAGRAYLS